MLLLEVITRNIILYNQMKAEVVLTIRNEAFLRFFFFTRINNFVLNRRLFRIIIERNRQFDGNYGTIANHELHKRASFMKMTQRCECVLMSKGSINKRIAVFLTDLTKFKQSKKRDIQSFYG